MIRQYKSLLFIPNRALNNTFNVSLYMYISDQGRYKNRNNKTVCFRSVQCQNPSFHVHSTLLSTRY